MLLNGSPGVLLNKTKVHLIYYVNNFRYTFGDVAVLND